MTEVAIPWWNVNLKKINNWTTTTYALMGGFDYTTNGGNNACSVMHDSLEWTASWYELTHNTPKHFQTCHKINNSIVSS